MIDHLEESDDRLCLATDGSENCPESQAEEYDAERVGAAPDGDDEEEDDEDGDYGDEGEDDKWDDA